MEATNYILKENQKYLPYPDDECPDLNCNDIIINVVHNIEMIVVAIKRDSYASGVFIRTGITWESNANLFDNFTKLDGSPIGKKAGE